MSVIGGRVIFMGNETGFRWVARKLLATADPLDRPDQWDEDREVVSSLETRVPSMVE